jgi:pimeloyl-ACP methyl ester carboxylesterase
MTRVIGILALLSAIVAGWAFAGGTTATRSSCVRSHPVRFRAADGTRLAGARYGRGTTAVVLAHQSNGNVCQWAFYARRLASLGYLAFPFDFRGHGESQFRHYPASRRLAADVTAAVKTVRRLGATKVVLVGASLGGFAVVVAGANTRPLVDGVVSLSGPANFGGADALASARRLQVPVLYLAGDDDDGFTDDAQALYQATATSNKALQLVPGTEHGVQLVSHPGEARTLVESFIAAR